MTCRCWPDSYRSDLFTNGSGEPLQFTLWKPCEFEDILKTSIEKGGGRVVDHPNGNSFELRTPCTGVPEGNEVYSTDYIKACCREDALLDIDLYRLNAKPLYKIPFSLMDVLLGLKTWKDVQRYRTNEDKIHSPGKSTTVTEQLPGIAIPSEEEPCIQNVNTELSERLPKDRIPELWNDSDSTNYEIDLPIRRKRNRELQPSKVSPDHHTSDTKWFSKLDNTNNDMPYSSGQPLRSQHKDDLQDSWSFDEIFPKDCTKKRKRSDYTYQEKLAILSYISEHKGYLKVKGRELWQLMSESGVCRNRTWQSLKEHYIKQIIPNLSSFHLSKAEEEHFLIPFQ